MKLLSFLLCVSFAAAVTREVNVNNGTDLAGGSAHGCGGCGEYACRSIGCALDVSQTGDVILVHPGIYTGAANKGLNIGSRELTLTGVSGDWSDTIIDCGGAGQAIYIDSSSSSKEVTIQGFTIRNCVANLGPAIQSFSASLSLRNMYIYNNRGDSPAVDSTVFSCETLRWENVWFDANSARTNSLASGGAVSVNGINQCSLLFVNVSVTNTNQDDATKQSAYQSVDIVLHGTLQWDGGVVANNYGAPIAFSNVVYISARETYISGLTVESNTCGNAPLLIGLGTSGVYEIVCSTFRDNTVTYSTLSAGGLVVVGGWRAFLLHNSSIVANHAPPAPANTTSASGLYLGFARDTQRAFISNSVVDGNIPQNAAIQNQLRCQRPQNFPVVSAYSLFIDEMSVVGSFNETLCNLVTDEPGNNATACTLHPRITATTVQCPSFLAGGAPVSTRRPVCEPSWFSSTNAAAARLSMPLALALFLVLAVFLAASS